MKGAFSEDSEIIASRGDWHLAIYNKRCVSLISTSGNSIQSPSCVVEENEDCTIKDEAFLIDELCRLFMEQRKRIAELEAKHGD